MQQRRAEGWPNGAPGRKVDPAMMPVYRRVLALHRAGQNPSQIAATLDAEKVPTARGGRWAPATVRRMVLSETAKALAS